MPRRLRSLLTVLLIPLVVGCSSAFSLGYEAGPYLLSREIEKRIPLNSQEEDSLDAALDGYFDWHRSKMLGDYVVALSTWRRDIQDKRSTRLWLWPVIAELVADTLLPLGEIVCAPMSRFTPADVESFKERDAEARKDAEKRWRSGSREEREKRSWDRFQSFIEDWIGDFTPEQAKRWNTTFRETVKESAKRQGQGRTRWNAFMTELEAGMSFESCFGHMSRWISPTLNNRVERNGHWVTLYDQVFRELTPEQITHLDGELETWIRRLRDLQE